jgi:type IV secretion system protein VirB6
MSGIFSLGLDVLRPFSALELGDLSNFAFFQLINDFLRSEIDIYTWKLLTRFTTLITTVALTLLTIWIFFQGYMIISGRSRESLMGLVVDSLRNVLIVTFATSMALGASGLYWSVTDGLGQVITEVVADESDPYSEIDKNLAVMTASFAVIDALPDEEKLDEQDDKDRAQLFTGIGIAGPAVIASALLLLNKLAMAMFIGFGPLFVLCLLFKQTANLFQRWLLYGIGTLFSLGVLVVMVNLTTKVVGAVAAAFLVKYAASDFGLGGTNEGINSMALQQGGLGLVMSTLIVMAPPMAAMFFSGTLGQFVANSSFGNVGRNSTGQVSDFRQEVQRAGGGAWPRNDNVGAQTGQNRYAAGTYDSTPTYGSRTPSPG